MKTTRARALKTVRGIRIGSFVEFAGPDAQSVMGRCVKIEETAGYCTIHVDTDGVISHFGTGGHLGVTWTTGDGRYQWFLDRVAG